MVGLVERDRIAHFRAMTWRHHISRHGKRIALLSLGWFLLAITPLVGPIPGPGGVVTFALGAGLVLKNSQWAKRRYVRLKARWPKAGAWADWALRRQSAKRRLTRRPARS